MIDSLLGLTPHGAGTWVNKDPLDDYWYEPRGVQTVAGVDINEDAALRFTTVYACVHKLAKTEATLPVHIYERVDEKTRKPVDHELNELMYGQANDEATGVTVRMAMRASIELWGNAYVYLTWNNRMTELRAMEPLLPGGMRITRDENGELVYSYSTGHGAPQVIPRERLWHITGLSLNGITGVSTIAYNREAIALGKAATTFGSAFFGNGAWAGGFIQRSLEADSKKAMSKDAAQNFLDGLNDRFRGPEKAFGFGLLREDMDFKQLEMPFEDAMFLQTRSFQRVEICGMFDVPPSKIQDHERAIKANIEQQDINWAKDSIMPRCVMIEAAAAKRFFRGSKLYLRHNLAALMRGDFKSRMEGYQIGIDRGIWSVNEVRAMEDLNPVPGGDTHWRQMNMTPLTDSGVIAGGDGASTEPAPAAINPVAMLEPAVWMVADVIATKEMRAIENAVKKHLSGNGDSEGFQEWARTFYTAHVGTVVGVLSPIVAGLERTGVIVRPNAKQMAEEYCDQCFDSLIASCDKKTGLPEDFGQWQKDKAAGIAKRMLFVLTTSMKEKSNGQDREAAA